MDIRTYINLPVADLARTRAFYAALGFSFDERWSNENAAAMLIGGTAYAMLLTRGFFSGFIPGRAICPQGASEALIAIELDSRAAVDAIVAAALQHGGASVRAPQDLGFMYGHAFADPDGHIWEPFWMDPNAVPQGEMQ